MADPSFDIAKLKVQVTAMWRKGGGDTLVKAMSRGRQPAEGRMIGYCTTIKYLAGRTPGQMEDILGFRRDTTLKDGAEIFLVSPLPALTSSFSAPIRTCRREGRRSTGR